MSRRSNAGSKKPRSQIGRQFSTKCIFTCIVCIVCIVTGLAAPNRLGRGFAPSLQYTKNLLMLTKFSEHREPIKPAASKELTSEEDTERFKRGQLQTLSPDRNRAPEKGSLVPDHQNLDMAQTVFGSLQSYWTKQLEASSEFKSKNENDRSSELFSKRRNTPERSRLSKRRNTLGRSRLSDPESVLWTAESARKCVSNNCIVRSNFTTDRWRGNGWTDSGLELRRSFEEKVRNASTLSGRWPNSGVARQAFSDYEDATCTVVGGAPFSENPHTRSAYIDGEQSTIGPNRKHKTIRINLALPFALKAGNQRLPVQGENIDASLGLGTKTDVLFLNSIALRQSRCFLKLQNGTELFEHLRNTVVIVLLIEPPHADLFNQCFMANEKKRGGPNDNGLKLFPLNPIIPESAVRTLLDVIRNVPESEKILLRIPRAYNRRGFLPTSGFMAVLSSLRLCGSVRTKGLAGSLYKNHLNQTYKACACHSIATERVALRKIADCNITLHEDTCKKLVSVQ